MATAAPAKAIPTMAPVERDECSEDDGDLDSEGRLVCAASDVVVTEPVEEIMVVLAVVVVVVVVVVAVVADVVEVEL